MIHSTARMLMKLLEEVGFELVGQHVLPAREAVNKPLPTTLHHSVYQELSRTFPQGLFEHQVDAIEAFLAGSDICLATSTGSGKSLVFMTAAVHLLQADPTARVLALYPAKALIQDQRAKWRAMLEPHHLHFEFIDGSVDVKQRPELLTRSRVILMTPDVAHAWLMGHLQEPHIHTFLQFLGSVPLMLPTGWGWSMLTVRY